MHEPSEITTAESRPTAVQRWLSAKSLRSGALGALSTVGLFSLQDLLAGREFSFLRFVVSGPTGLATIAGFGALWIAFDRWDDRTRAMIEHESLEVRAHYWNDHIDRWEKPGWWWRTYPVVLPGVVLGAALSALVVWTSDTPNVRDMLTWSAGAGLFAGAIGFAFVALTRKAVLRRLKEQ